MISASFGEIAASTFSNSSIYVAVATSFLFISLGYIITKKELFTKDLISRLSRFVFTWVLPFLGIFSFMRAADITVARVLPIVLGLSIGFYLLTILIAEIIIRFIPKLISERSIDKAAIAWQKNNAENLIPDFKQHYIKDLQRQAILGSQLSIYSSITFFTIPLVFALPGIFGGSAIGILWIWHITFSILVNSHSRIAIGGEKLSFKEMAPFLKKVFNPTLILTLVSLALWSLQFIPAINNLKFKEWFIPVTSEETGGSTFWDFQVTLPFVYRPINIVVGLLSPLIWLSIGGSLATSNLKQGFKNKTNYFYTVIKLMIMPLLLFLIMIPFVKYGWFGSDPNTAIQIATLIVIMQAAPPAAIIMLYSVMWNNKISFTSQITSLATFISLITIPIWLIISQLVFRSIVGI